MSFQESKKTIVLIFSILVLGILLDQVTKYLAVQYLMNHPPHYFFNGMFQLVYAENPGAFLGMGGQMSRPVRFLIFGVFVLGGLLFMLWMMVKNKMPLKEIYAYSLIISGGFGNVIDRLFHDNGHVVDFLFIDLKFHPLARTGVFNVADMLIVLGFLIILPSVFKSSKEDGHVQSN